MARLISDDFKRKLDSDFITAEDSEDKIQSVFASYLCVRVAGYLETCLKEEIISYIEKRCPSHIKSFIAKAIQNTTNLTHKKIKEALRSFSEDWGENFEQNMTEEMRQSVGSIYDNRNSIAHGKSCNISLREVKRHYSNIKDVVVVIHQAMTSNPR